jgi:dihydrofolate reductase
MILSMMVSADGYIEAPGNDINWHVFDEEMSEYMMGFFGTVDTFIYGRKSYELMLSFWPHESGPFADVMNQTSKIIFSKTLESVEWNSRLVKDNVVEEIGKLKQQPGKDAVLFAGADLAATFIRHNLIDEYRLIVNPVVLGAGTPLFKDVQKKPFNLQLVDTLTFGCGNVILIYRPEKKSGNHRFQ